jgi:hypothetical protein
MNWEKLTPFLELAIEKVMSISDVDERYAMLIFYVAEMVEKSEREICIETLRKSA